jgi:acyl-coenzyme A thioesterase PaaI-like protein
MDETALAQQVGQVMFANDRATRETVGMDLLSCTPGRASMRMVVQDKHLNGHQTCHGGFSLLWPIPPLLLLATATTTTLWRRRAALSF